MAINDLRQWLDAVDKMGALQKVEGADCEEEIGCISDLNAKKKDCPALVFDHINGYPPGYRIVTCSLIGPRRVGLSLNLGEIASTRELLDTLKKQMPAWESQLNKFPPHIVSSGPALDNIMAGGGVDLLRFPVPKWHAQDGGRYIGTGNVVVTKDPETGEINLGTYRVMLHDKSTVGLYISPGHHGRIQCRKYHDAGKPCPVLISIGHDPLIFGIGCLEVPSGSEYAYIGAIRGQPVPVIEEEITQLPFPAHSEIVLAGWCPPDEMRLEGPFGEWTGYYASKAAPAPIVNVERIYYRNDPIMLGLGHGIPPCDGSYWQSVMQSARVYSDLEKMGVPDVQTVWRSEIGGRLLFVVSIKQRYAGHAKHAAMAIAQGSRVSAYMGRYVIVVDEDIDPTNIEEVIWALTTRTDPVNDIDIVRRAWSTPLDPMIRKPSNAFFNSRAIIDACKPYEWIDEFPAAIAMREEVVERVKAKWGDLF